MKKVLVKIYFLPGGHGHCMTSFIHPFLNRAIRKKFNTKKEALEYKLKIESKYLGKNLKNCDDMTIADAIYILLSKKPQSYLRSNKKLFEDFCHSFGEFSAKDLTEDIIDIWFRQIKEENDYAENTMFGIKVQFNTVFKFLKREKIINRNPMIKINTVRTPPIRRKRIHLHPEQINFLLTTLKRMSPGHLYPIILFLNETACKTFEIFDLEWNDVNFKTNTISFRKTKKLQERSIKMSSTLAKTLKEKKVFSDFVFTDSNYEQLNKNKLKRAINEFKRKSELDFDWSCSDIRHSFAYNYLEKSQDLNVLSYHLGHRTLHETKTRYMKAMKTIPEIKPLY